MSQDNTNEENLPNLADPKNLGMLLFTLAQKQVELESTFGNEKLSLEEMEEAHLNMVFWVASAICGEVPEFSVPEGWDPTKLGAGIRSRLAKRVAAMSASDRELFSEDDRMVLFAVGEFVKDLAWLSNDPEAQDDMQARLFDLCADWAEAILGDMATEWEEIDLNVE